MQTRSASRILASIVLAALIPAVNTEKTPAQTEAAPGCRIAATASKTRNEGQKGFRSEATSTCRFDRAASQSTCTNEYVDSVGTKTTTVTVTTFASVADAIEEVKVIPPLRLSTRIETKSSGPQRSSTTVVVNSYDGQRRLVKEAVTVSTAAAYSTTYTAWDKRGRPTAGSTLFVKAQPAMMEMSYNDAARTVTTTHGAGAHQMTCGLTFDANGNPASTECHAQGGAPGSMSRSTTTTTGTEKLCR